MYMYMYMYMYMTMELETKGCENDISLHDNTIIIQ